MKLRPIYALLFLFLIAGMNEAWSQKKVLGMPKTFKNPYDYFDSPANYKKYITERTSSKEKKVGWLVFSDRADNPVYSKPNGSLNGTKLAFKSSYYVVEEKGEWIKIVDTRVDGLKVVDKKKVKEIGWVKKENMLLWYRGIVDPQSRIHRKILMLHDAEEVARIIAGDKESVTIYDGPNGKEIGTQRIMQYFFILKKEANSILIASEVEIGAGLSNKSLIGWVDKRDCTAWDSRVCLEPNFKQPAFDERKSNKDYHIKGFQTFASAKNYVEQNDRKSGDVFWDSDPVKLDRKILSKSNAYRFNGSLIRFPMVSLEKTNTSAYFQTGVVGNIVFADKNKVTDRKSEAVMSQLKDERDKVNNKATNVNVFFVIEGTESTAPYKEHIINAMQEFRVSNSDGINFKYGALVYRGLKEKDGNRVTEHIEPSAQLNKTIEFVRNTEFKNIYHRGEYTTMYYGIDKSLQVANFSDKELNIMILIGSNGDFKSYKPDKLYAKQNNRPEYVEDVDGLIENLDKVEAHLYSIQLNNDGFKSTKLFLSQSRKLILGTGKYAYNSSYGSPSSGTIKSRFDVSLPTMIMEDGEKRIPLNGASTLGAINKPLVNNFLTFDEVKKALIDEVGKSVEFTTKFKSVIDELIGNGKSLDEVRDWDDKSFNLAPAVAAWLDGVVKSKGVSVDNMLNEKLVLFTEVYIPQKMVGTQYNTSSFVLFMPENDLKDYIGVIKNCLVNAPTYDKKREALMAVYASLTEQYTGDKDKAKTISRSDLLRQMQGLQGSGLEIEDPLDHKIPEILNKRKVSNDKVDQIIDRFQVIYDNLNDIVRKGDNYDFCYASGGFEYFWIPIEMVW